MYQKTKYFLKQNETKIITIAGIILVAVLSFEVGVLKGSKLGQNQVIIEQKQTVLGENTDRPAAAAPEASNLAPEAAKTAPSSTIPAQNCAFVGSKNSTKIHVPTCSFAKRIKPENVVCFATLDDAIKAGRQPDKGCIK
jgi:hypothetical protein